MSGSRKRPHFGVFISTNEDEHASVQLAAEAMGMNRAVSTWVRSVLLREAARESRIDPLDEPDREVGDKKTAVFVNVTEDEHKVISGAATRSEMSAGNWARTVLLRETRKILRKL